MAATSSVPATEAAKRILGIADQAMGFHHQCGLSRAAQTDAQYAPDGRLWSTNKYGVYEVSPASVSLLASQAPRHFRCSCSGIPDFGGSCPEHCKGQAAEHQPNGVVQMASGGTRHSAQAASCPAASLQAPSEGSPVLHVTDVGPAQAAADCFQTKCEQRRTKAADAHSGLLMGDRSRSATCPTPTDCELHFVVLTPPHVGCAGMLEHDKA